MRDLEEKEKELNKLKVKADALLNKGHPASDKIEVFCFSLNLKIFLSLVLSLWKPTGLHGDPPDPVELASADHKMHRSSFERELFLQPGKSRAP